MRNANQTVTNRRNRRSLLAVLALFIGCQAMLLNGCQAGGGAIAGALQSIGGVAGMASNLAGPVMGIIGNAQSGNTLGIISSAFGAAGATGTRFGQAVNAIGQPVLGIVGNAQSGNTGGIISSSLGAAQALGGVAGQFAANRSQGTGLIASDRSSN